MPEFLRIAHCQYESHAGKFAENLAKFEAGLERADRERVQVVSFPECFLNGYPDTGERTRQVAFAVDSPEAMRVLDVSSRFEATAIVGFNEVRGPDLFNTAMVVHRGHLLGTYSKCMAYQPFHRQGRVFPIFERDGVKFGVVICADGGYYEPTRILALKGARIIFAPHFNYIAGPGVISHFMKVRADHTARAIENGVYFVRGNNVVNGIDPAITRTEGIGYGDSYVIDPGGEILARTRRHTEDFLMADLDTKNPNYDFRMKQARTCWHALKSHFEEAMGADRVS
ncbi:MAG: carbon-nitrogen hydrolase family protein [Planctomycetaceae bacterium]|nr:carbon-nitrogen hydrolase family protein [Planctomycetaceae bacterium]